MNEENSSLLSFSSLSLFLFLKHIQSSSLNPFLIVISDLSVIWPLKSDKSCPTYSLLPVLIVLFFLFSPPHSERCCVHHMIRGASSPVNLRPRRRDLSFTHITQIHGQSGAETRNTRLMHTTHARRHARTHTHIHATHAPATRTRIYALIHTHKTGFTHRATAAHTASF